MQANETVDPLLNCLVIITNFYHHPLSADALRAGLPLVDNRLTPSLFIRAAERAGLSAKIVKRSLNKIPKLVLPAVLILHDNQACILRQFHPDGSIELTFPEVSTGSVKKSLAELQEIYTGYAIFLQPIFKIDTLEDERPKTSKSWFWSTMWLYRRTFGEVMVAALLINLFALVSPLFVMNVYDRVVPNSAYVTLWVLAIGVFIIFGFDLLLRMLRGYLIDVVGKKADILLASSLFQHIMNMKLAHKPQSTGAFINNIREFETIRDFFTSATFVTFIDLPFIFLYLLFTAYIGGWIVAIPLTALPIILAIAYFLEIPMRRYVTETIQGAAQKHAVLVESIGGMESIKSLAAEGVMQRKWENYVGAVSSKGLRARLYGSTISNLSNFIQQLAYVGIIIYGVYLISNQALSLGGLIACSILSARSLAPITQLTGLLTRYQQARIALKNLNDIMDLPVERPADKHFLQRPSIQGNIEFSNVTFQYPNQQNKALNNVSFKIKAGERVAFIGRVGSGKTTVQKLLLNLYQPQEGMIYIDGTDIAHIDPIDLRNKIGYVSQDCSLFSGNIRDNINMGKPYASDEKILQAAEVAGVDSLVKNNPAGFDLFVGERGEHISGGQKQSIAIARAFVSDPIIVLMDEPTSAMDTRSEQELLLRLSKYLSQKTLILISHRPSLLNLVDRIIVMDSGKILLDGSKEEIIKKVFVPQNPPPAASKGHFS